MIWWSWCLRFLCLRWPSISVTCCCVRSESYWACSTVTSLSERSVHLMSTGEALMVIYDYIFYLFYPTFTNFIFIHPLLPLLSTRLVFLVSGGPGRPPLSGHSVALGLRNKLHKQKNDFLIFKARRVDTVSEYWQVAAKMFVTSLYNFIIIIIIIQ